MLNKHGIAEDDGRLAEAHGIDTTAGTLPPMATMTARPPIMHRVKSWPQYFKAMSDGAMTFTVRVNDRDYRLGDYLQFEEYRPDGADGERVTGRILSRRICYIFDGENAERFGIKAGHVVLGIEPLSAPPR